MGFSMVRSVRTDAFGAYVWKLEQCACKRIRLLMQLPPPIRSMQRVQPCPVLRSRAGGSGVDSGMWKMRSSGDEQPSVDGNHDVNGDSNGMEVVLRYMQNVASKH